MRSDEVTVGAARAPHRSLLRALGVGRQDAGRPLIGVANSFNELVPGHMHLKSIAAQVKYGVYQGGGIPLEFDVIGVCDGLAMNHEGMNYSLVSREVIADSVEVMARAHGLDGLVLIPNCDKIVPGISIANSEVGILAFSIEAYFYRLVCSNGLVSKTAVASRFKHISRRALEEFPHILRQVIYESERNQNRLVISTQSRVDDPLATIGSFNRQFQITKKEAETIEQAWQIEQGYTMFHVIGAYTRAAHDSSLTAEEAYKLERIGGQILSLVKQ